MKLLSNLWLIASLTILPCTLDQENPVCLAVEAASLALSFRCFKKHNPEYILTKKK